MKTKHIEELSELNLTDDEHTILDEVSTHYADMVSDKKTTLLEWTSAYDTAYELKLHKIRPHLTENLQREDFQILCEHNINQLNELLFQAFRQGINYNTKNK